MGLLNKYFNSFAAAALVVASSATPAYAKANDPDKMALVKACERIEGVLSKEPYNSQKLYSSLLNLSGLIERRYGQCGNDQACKDNLKAEQGWYRDYIETLLAENDLTLNIVALALFGNRGSLMVAFSMIQNCENCQDLPVIQEVQEMRRKGYALFAIENMALYCIDNAGKDPEMDTVCQITGYALEQQ